MLYNYEDSDDIPEKYTKQGFLILIGLVFKFKVLSSYYSN